MFFYSTNKRAPEVDFKAATILGQAPDKGLYFPEQIPSLSTETLKDLKSLSKEEIAYRVIHPYVGNTIPEIELRRIVEATVNFDFPLVRITEDVFALELFHGPTLAFKDVGARFMSRCLGYFSKGRERGVTVLVATSGDTGGAVASGFDGVHGVRVVILYPRGKVSKVQEWQLTTGGDNITALEVNGDFDDCQRLVKQAFADDLLREQMFLTSANSINVARWLPQQFYYFFALQQWPYEEPPVICVPSGNFGNICAGLFAQRSGLPVQHFLAACNANDTVPRYFQTGGYQPHASVQTISNAMDVSDPSNFVRILEMMGHDDQQLKAHISAVSINDDDTRDAIRRLYNDTGYVLDPHGAVGWLALRQWLSKNPNQRGIFLETAHPVKFPDAVEAATGRPLELPLAISALADKPGHKRNIDVSYDGLKEILVAGG